MLTNYPSIDIMLKDIEWIQSIFSAKDLEYATQKRAADEYRLDIRANRPHPLDYPLEHTHRHPDVPCLSCAQNRDARFQREVRNPEGTYIPFPSLLYEIFDIPDDSKEPYYNGMVKNFYHSDTSLYPDSESRYREFLNKFEKNPFFKMRYLEDYHLSEDDPSNPSDFMILKLTGFSMFTCGMCDLDGYILPAKPFYKNLKDFEEYTPLTSGSKRGKHETYEELCVFFTFFILSHAFYYAFKDKLQGSRLSMKSLFQQASLPSSL